MGRWTVAEWLAQAQEFSPLPGGEDDVGYGDGTWSRRIDTLLEEDEDDFEDDDDEGDYEKPLPPSPLQVPGMRPAPPPKIYIAGPPALSNAARPPEEGRVHKLFGAMRETKRTRGKRGKGTETSGPSMTEKPRRIAQGDRNGLQVSVASPTASSPRSLSTHRPREFLVRSNTKRVTSKSKSSKPASPRRTDGYTYNGHALEILVSTQVTATPSAHDAGRPRVFYPRSSSLPGARNNAPPPPVKNSMPMPPVPSKYPPQATQRSRALPAVPSAPATNALTNSSIHRSVSATGGASNATRQIRPLPVPTRPPP
ncbi:hypothetical protein DFH06DRAFT_719332 [Mycena polygramma]|nr:hypothetical protein DFH06DRAFT_719332 [Mycena polygramma]